jgi:hypothetical protein
MSKVQEEGGEPSWLTSALVENGKPEVVWSPPAV